MRRVDAVAIPRNESELDAEWMSRALGVHVVSVQQAERAGGIPVTSRVVRLRVQIEPAGAGPSSVVVKLANPRWQHGSEVYEREVRFYRDFATVHPLPVPRCYYADLDPDSGAFVLVLEDLSEVVPGHRLEGLTEEEALAVIDGVADLHRAWWQRPELASLRLRAHDDARIERTVSLFPERWQALKSAGRYPLGLEIRTLKDSIVRRYRTGMLRISQQPHTLIHSDLHVENFFLKRTPGGLQLLIIDWQNPCFGNCAFDVGHVLTSLQAGSAACGDHLLERYHERVGVPGYALGQLRDDVTAAIRHQFVGSLNWFATYEAQSLRAADTMQSHWQRLCAAVVEREAYE